MDPGSFLQGRSRETTIRRDAQGRWYFDGEPLEHPNLVRAFDRWIGVADDGRYCLKNDINWAYITLEGPPFFVRSAYPLPDETVELLLSDDSREPLDPRSLREGPDGALYCDVHGGRMSARFERHAMQQLEALLREDDEGVYLALAGEHVRPARVSDPLASTPNKAQS